MRILQTKTAPMIETIFVLAQNIGHIIVVSALISFSFGCDDLGQESSDVRSAQKNEASEGNEENNDGDQPTLGFDLTINSLNAQRIDPTRVDFSMDYSGNFPDNFLWQVLPKGTQGECLLIDAAVQGKGSISSYEIPFDVEEYDVCFFYGKDKKAISEVPLNVELESPFNPQMKLIGEGVSTSIVQIDKNEGDDTTADYVYETKGTSLIRREIDKNDINWGAFTAEYFPQYEVLYGSTVYNNNLYVIGDKKILVFENANKKIFLDEPKVIETKSIVTSIEVYGGYMYLLAEGQGVHIYNLDNYDNIDQVANPFYIKMQPLLTNTLKMKIHHDIFWVMGGGYIAAYNIDSDGGLQAIDFMQIADDGDGNKVDSYGYRFADMDTAIQYIFYGRQMIGVAVRENKIISIYQKLPYDIQSKNAEIDTMFEVEKKVLINTTRGMLFPEEYAKTLIYDLTVIESHSLLVVNGVYDAAEDINYATEPSIMTRYSGINPRYCLRSEKVSICGTDGPMTYKVYNSVIPGKFDDYKEKLALFEAGDSSVKTKDDAIQVFDGAYGAYYMKNGALRIFDVSENGEHIGAVDIKSSTFNSWDRSLDLTNEVWSYEKNLLIVRTGITNDGTWLSYHDNLTGNDIRWFWSDENGAIKGKTFDHPDRENTSKRLTNSVEFVGKDFVTGTVDRKVFVFSPNEDESEYEVKASFNLDVPVDKIRQTKDNLFVIGNGAIYIMDKKNLLATPVKVLLQGSYDSALLQDNFLLLGASNRALSIIDIRTGNAVLVDKRITNIAGMDTDGKVIAIISDDSQQVYLGNYDADSNKFRIAYRKDLPVRTPDGFNSFSIRAGKEGEFFILKSESFIGKFSY